MAVRNGTTERSIDGKHLVRLVATDRGTCAERFLDDRDQAIVDQRMRLMDTRPGPRVGDFVIFAHGVERRISYHWKDDEGWDGGVQTSDTEDTMGFYLGREGMSFSGGLHSSVPVESLTLNEETRPGRAWIFHHDQHMAHNGVDFAVPLRVFVSSEEAPR
jgi:hypothetical protein